MQVTVKNLTEKMRHLWLNNDDYVSIPARGSRSVDEARLKDNAVCDKLCKRGAIAVVEKKQAEKAPEEDKEEAAKAKTKKAEEDGKEDAVLDKSESTPEEGKEKESEDRPVTTSKPRDRTKKTSPLRGIVKKGSE